MANTTDNIMNLTEDNATLWRRQRMETLEWKLSLAVTVIVNIFSAYLLFALVMYELIKRGYLFRARNDFSDVETSLRHTDWSIRNEYSEGNTHHQERQIVRHETKEKLQPMGKRRIRIHEDHYETWMRLLSISAAWFAFCKCLTEYIDLFFGTIDTPTCMGFSLTTVMCNGCSLLSVYNLMWLRQWAVHSHHALQHLPIKTLKLLSWILLAVMQITFAALCVLNFVTIKLRPSIRGCQFADSGTVSQGARSASGIIFTGVFQPAMLALLLYPLVKHTLSTRKTLQINAHEKGSTKTRPRDKREERIYLLIKRLSIAVVLCTVSDALGVVASYELESYPIFYICVVYDYNITFGAYVIVCSFTNWRERLFPFLRRNIDKIHGKRYRTSMVTTSMLQTSAKSDKHLIVT